jgi:hypothetical protein
MSDGEKVVRRLIGVYDADGTMLGEVSYFVGARLGRAHCALCDITHGLVRQRAEWRAARDELPIEFVTYHRDDQPGDVRAAIGDRLPAVVAETADGVTLLLDGDDLEACGGDPKSLIAEVRRAVADQGLSFANS